MTFSVNSSEKKKIQKLVAVASARTRRLQNVAVVVLIVFILLGCLTALVRYLSPRYDIVVINGIETKDVASIISSLATWILIGIVIHIYLKALVSNWSSKDIGERAGEELLVTNGIIRYSFRIRYHSNGRDRNVIIIPMDKVLVDYSEECKRITLSGRMSSDYYEDYSTDFRLDPSSENLSELIIYDYFEPSLYGLLKIQ